MNQYVKKNNGLNWLWLTVLILVIDLASKFAILASFDLYDSVNLFPFFSITYIRNYGAAFGFLLGQRWILAIIALVVSIFIIRLLYRSPKQDYLSNCAFSLVLGGALGNLFDRLYHGFVVDFLDVNFGSWHYPAFNVADSAICIGVVLILLTSFKSSKTQDEATK